MDGILAPSNIIVALIVAVGLFFGIRRIVRGLTSGQSCCSDGEGGHKVKKVKVADTDASNYPYATDLLIGGMSCQGCAENVQNALNGLGGTWATVDLASKTAHILSKSPVDESACEEAVKNAGYYVMKV